MKRRVSNRLYRIIKWLVWLFYPKMTPVGAENLPQEPVIIVGNHCQMNGPITSELYVPGPHYTWCAGQLMHLKEVPAYAYEDFWAGKPGCSRWFYKLLSYLIAPLSVCVFNNANTIGVYRDARGISTFKQSVSKLESGASLVIFPENGDPYSHIVTQFQDKFIDVARLYYKRTGKELCFVPMYVAPNLKGFYFGEAIRFCACAPTEAERSRICTYLMEQITQIAQSLPRHKVVPYRNIRRKDYPLNIPERS